MRVLYLLSVWVHIVAATVWVGGIAFLMLVVVPWLRRGKVAAGEFLRETGTAFRRVAWVCFGLVFVTGSFNLWVRGVRLDSFTDAAWRASPFGHATMAKLGFFALVLALSLFHDFVAGPRATTALREGASPAEAERRRRLASWLGRANAVLALLLVALGVILVRGAPF